MKTIKISDFSFRFRGHGHYSVTYTSPVTGKKWSTITDNVPLVDKTYWVGNPTQKDLNELKRICKR